MKHLHSYSIDPDASFLWILFLENLISQWLQLHHSSLNDRFNIPDPHPYTHSVIILFFLPLRWHWQVAIY